LRKLIVSEFVSLDGVMEAPGGEPGHPHSGWVFDFMGEEQLRNKLNETLEAESLLIGRVTYESFAGAWPRRKGEFAEKMNAMPKHVASRTLKNPEWNNTTVIGGNVVTEVEKLKRGDGGPILVAGSRMLVHTLLGEDLVDELRVMIFPVILGSGKRLFPDSPRKTVLSLADAQKFASGVVLNTYHPAARAKRSLTSADREIDDALATLERPAVADVKARGQ
jgi:dihydrofolate reductase